VKKRGEKEGKRQNEARTLNGEKPFRLVTRTKKEKGRIWKKNNTRLRRKKE